jgi:4-diphosphocytidyl-2C-methyl-D-erythritol kinase
VKGLEEGDEELIINSMGNDLMPAAVSMLPEVEKIHKMLLADGFKIASMTGSGSTCFAISTDSRKCKEAAHKYEKLGYNTSFCRVFSK